MPDEPGPEALVPHFEDAPDDALTTDKGPERPGPIRSCVVTRERHPTGELIRFVAGPDGGIVPDLKRKLPGRGVWIRARQETIDAAVKRKAFGRALKADVKAAADLSATVGLLLERDALQALSLANKAGAVTIGHAKVEAAIEKRSVRAIFHASDAAPDGIRKIGQAIHRVFSEKSPPTVLLPFTSTQMSLCLGREHVIHLCLANSPASEPVLAKCLLFLRYRGLPGLPDDPAVDRALGSAEAGPGLSIVKTSEP